MKFDAIFAVGALLMTSCAHVSDRSTAQRRADELSKFTTRLDALRTAAKIPGMSVAIVRDGEVVYARGFGYADLEQQIPATPETPYDIASVTKPLSAVVAVRLAEEGRLDLDRPMAGYSDWAGFCSEFREQPTIFAKDLACVPPTHTLRHLLTHTATGLPGTRFSYNPILYSWASRPIMQATGTSFSLLVEQYVFRAAGMTKSARRHRDLPLRDDLVETIALPYHVDGTGAFVRSPKSSPQGDGAAGGIVSTALDLARFDIALESGSLLAPASYAAMMRPASSHDGASLAYSLGWFAQQYEGHEIRWHSGWWDDAYSALYLKVLDRNLTLIVLANSEGVWWDNPLDSAQVHRSAFAQAFFEAFL